MHTPAHSYEAGCRCPECAEGLLAYAPDRDRYQAALNRLRPALHIVTMPSELEPDPCEGTYSCGCARCTHQRAALMHQGTRDRPQPWDIKRRAA